MKKIKDTKKRVLVIATGKSHVVENETNHYFDLIGTAIRQKKYNCIVHTRENKKLRDEVIKITNSANRLWNAVELIEEEARELEDQQSEMVNDFRHNGGVV